MRLEQRIYAILGIVVGIGACIITIIVGIPELKKLFATPTPLTESFEYQVRVQEQGSLNPIGNAKVTIDLGGGTASKVVFTDSNGFARIIIDPSYAGKPGRLIVEADGYERVIQNIDLSRDQLPNNVQLTPLATSQ